MRAVAMVAVKVDETSRPALAQAKLGKFQLELPLISELAKSVRPLFTTHMLSIFDESAKIC